MTTIRWQAGFFVGMIHMEPPTTNPEPAEHPHPVKPAGHGHPAYHPHHVKPIDSSYQLVVRIVLWVIAGAVLVGLCIWWVAT
jgi:hypothetical protein